ncbi:hypothetical protein WA026_013111 [Henosepilachna vigintioctopunctata]|uniref:Uncharacterized protein n=1 Tax=Henosepilachna vigintioctopunctata TaxID=420089 RepID=A0AAW1UMW6_9CUCU
MEKPVGILSSYIVKRQNLTTFIINECHKIHQQQATTELERGKVKQEQYNANTHANRATIIFFFVFIPPRHPQNLEEAVASVVPCKHHKPKPNTHRAAFRKYLKVSAIKCVSLLMPFLRSTSVCIWTIYK